LLHRHRALAATLLLAIALLPLALAVPAEHAGAHAAGHYEWPLEGRVTRGFTKPTGPYGEGGHQGLDIACASGAAVRSAGDGTVDWVGEVPRGRCVSISHPGGVRTVYLDLDRIDVCRGTRVAAGQTIGTVLGGRDVSSPEPHLHFDAYMNGVPVDPHVLFEGLSTDSFIRLIPVTAEPPGAVSASPSSKDDPGLWARVPRGVKALASGAVDSLKGALRLLAAGGIGFGRGAAHNARWVARQATALWSGSICPSMRATGRFFAGAWRNRFVKAVVAGLAAALAIVILVALAVVALGVSLLVGAIAAVLGAVACLVAAIVYAVCHPNGFGFATCFLRSLCAGGLAAGLVMSGGSLTTAFGAGWYELGILGTLKGALLSGCYSALFEAGTSYLFTGAVHLQKILVAFCVGAFSGAVARTLLKGIRSSTRLVEILSFCVGEGQAGLAGAGQTLAVLFDDSAVLMRGFIVTVRATAVRLGVKAAYLCFSGTLGAGINAVVCLATRKPITVSGMLAAFCTGAVMGVVALSFDVRGIGGMLERLSFFREGVGERLKSIAATLINKSLHKAVSNGFKGTFKKLFKEEGSE